MNQQTIFENDELFQYLSNIVSTNNDVSGNSTWMTKDAIVYTAINKYICIPKKSITTRRFIQKKNM